MIKRVLFLLAALWAGAAWADAPVSMVKLLLSDGNHYYATTADACAASAAYSQQVNTQGYTFSCYSSTSTGWTLKKLCTSTAATKAGCAVNTSTYIAETAQFANWCPSGVAPDTTKPLAQQCPAKCLKDAESVVRVNYGANFTRPFVTSDIPTSYGGCVVNTIEFQRCASTVSTGALYCVFRVKNTGVQDLVGSSNEPQPESGPGAPGTENSATLGPVKSPDALSCPKGTVQAGMSADGIPMCVGTGTTPNTSTASNTVSKPATTVTNADGSTTKTEVTQTTNSDGSVTTSTKTTSTAADGTVTVAVGASTGNTPSGQPGKPGANGTNGANGQDGKALCDANPNLNVCRNSTVAGDCTSGVTYTGDAIQGATLQAANAIKCKQQKDDDDLKASAAYAKGSAVLAGNDPDGSSLPTMGNAASVAVPTSLDTAGFAGGGSPFSDVSFSVQGKSFTLPFNKWSSYLEAFKYVMMVIASLVSFRILSGAILRD